MHIASLTLAGVAAAFSAGTFYLAWKAVKLLERGIDDAKTEATRVREKANGVLGKLKVALSDLEI